MRALGGQVKRRYRKSAADGPLGSILSQLRHSSCRKPLPPNQLDMLGGQCYAPIASGLRALNRSVVAAKPG
jgi:hypothetical protein